MFASMTTHIYELLRFGYSPERRFGHSFRLAYECNDGAIGGRSRIDIKDTDPIYGPYGRNYPVYHIHIATLAEVGNAFYKFFHCVLFLFVIKIELLTEKQKLNRIFRINSIIVDSIAIYVGRVELT